MNLTSYEKYANWYYGPLNHSSHMIRDAAEGDRTMSAGYYGFVIGMIFVGLILAVLLGSWLNGARWLNKKNPRIAGEVYKRTTLQNSVFIIANLVFGLLLFATKWTDLFRDNLRGPTTFAIINFWHDPGTWMFQCAIVSLFILPWLLFFNKAKWIAVIAPFTILAAITTIMHPVNMAEDAQSILGWEMHRKILMHVLLVVLPVYAMVAARIRLTTKYLFGAIIYTTLLNFAVALYIFSNFGSTLSKHKLPYQGEFGMAAEALGFSETWAADNFWLFVVGIMGSITFAAIIVLWLLYNFIFYALTTKYKRPEKVVKTSETLVGTFSSEVQTDRMEWYGFKWWGNNSVYERTFKKK